MIIKFLNFEDEKLIQKAKQFAKQAHEGQYRKFGKKLPYFSHPEKVAKIIISLSDKLKDSKKLVYLIVAAYLHDVVEDSDYTINDIEKLFGHFVAQLVNELTSDKEKIKILGKEKYLVNKVLNISYWALIIKLADRLDNVSDISYLINTDKNQINWAKNYSKQTHIIISQLEKSRKFTRIEKPIIEILIKRIKSNIIPESKLNELKTATPKEYYQVIDNMYHDNIFLSNSIKDNDNMFPDSIKYIYKTDDNNLFLHYAESNNEIYVLGLASKIKRVNKSTLKEMYELFSILENKIRKDLIIYLSVNNKTELLLKRIFNIIKNQGYDYEIEMLYNFDFGDLKEYKFKTYKISIF